MPQLLQKHSSGHWGALTADKKNVAEARRRVGANCSIIVGGVAEIFLQSAYCCLFWGILRVLWLWCGTLGVKGGGGRSTCPPSLLVLVNTECTINSHNKHPTNPCMPNNNNHHHHHHRREDRGAAAPERVHPGGIAERIRPGAHVPLRQYPHVQVRAALEYTRACVGPVLWACPPHYHQPSPAVRIIHSHPNTQTKTHTPLYSRFIGSAAFWKRVSARLPFPFFLVEGWGRVTLIPKRVRRPVVWIQSMVDVAVCSFQHPISSTPP